MSLFISQRGAASKFSSADSWVLLTPIEKRIKEKLELSGTPLKDWNINIYRGVLTGYNEAFIIDGKKKDELITADPKSAEIIRPILRGRDIKRYGYEFGDLWLINTHNGIKEKGIKSLKIDDYPIIKDHLDKFYSQLEQRADKGDTPYNLRNCAYTEDFFKQKIVWGNLNLEASYCLAESGMYINAPCTMIVDANKYLLAVLNSKLADYYIRSLGVTRNGGYFEYKPMFIEKLPVPIITELLQSQFDNLVDAIIEIKKRGGSTTQMEKTINELIFDLYNIDSEEINFIESYEYV